MNSTEVANLKVGDEVGFGYGGYTHTEGFGTVTKINGHGHVFVERKLHDGTTEVMKFNKYGDTVGGTKFHSPRLCDAKQLHESRAERKAAREQSTRVSDLLDYIAGMRCWNGSYHVTDEYKAKLLEMVNAL